MALDSERDQEEEEEGSAVQPPIKALRIKDTIPNKGNSFMLYMPGPLIQRCPLFRYKQINTNVLYREVSSVLLTAS